MDFQSLILKLESLTHKDSLTGCWLIHKTNTRGHAQIRFNGKTYGIHRLSAHIYHGLDLNNSREQANHKQECPHRNCWNPDHIYVGDQVDNRLDTVKTGHWANQNSRKTHCQNGHLLDEINSRKSGGGRHCIICKKEYDKRRRDKHKQYILTLKRT